MGAKQVEECIKKLKQNIAVSISSKCTKVLRDAAKGLVKQNVDLAKQEARLLSKEKRAVKKSVPVVKAADHKLKPSVKARTKMSAPPTARRTWSCRWYASRENQHEQIPSWLLWQGWYQKAPMAEKLGLLPHHQHRQALEPCF